MNPQHLSDEAVAAFADGVLTGHARTRAMRHTALCAECDIAVREQRLAVLALRSAPAPSLPSGLVERLRGLPAVTPLRSTPTTVDSDGSVMFSTMTPPAFLLGASAAAFVPMAKPSMSSAPPSRPAHRIRPLATTAALLAVAGVLTTGAVLADPNPVAPGNGTTLRDVSTVVDGPGRNADQTFQTVTLFRQSGR